MSYTERLAALMHEPSTDAGDDPARLRRVEISRGEMLRQGAAIRATLDAGSERIAAIAAGVRSRGLRRVVIIGCGDSLGIGIGVRAAFEALLGVPTEAIQALDFAGYAYPLADETTLVIGISASGATEAVLSGLDKAAARGASVLGVSNNAASVLATGFAHGLVVHATRKGWPTQSTTAAMALLVALAVDLAKAFNTTDAKTVAALRTALDAIPAMVDEVTADLDPIARKLAEQHAEVPIILFAGAGPHFATAFFGASKIKELAPIHALSLPLEEYHHYRTQKLGDLLFLVAPDAASRARAVDAALVGRAVGGRTIALVPEGEAEIAALVDATFSLPPVRPDLAPIVYSVPLHLFAYHFAKARFARNLGYPGRDPVAPQH
jgi:glucosamine--fructose-6-phosphate aminotransferase (isomerizing)